MKGNVLHKKVRIMLALLALISVVFVFSITQGLSVDYRPANPVMDYVPQYIGVYDTYYGYLAANDCRVCHGSREAGAKRHQFTVSAFAGCPDGCILPAPDCLSACHTDPNNPQSITDDCLSCHPASSGVWGGPHHETDLAGLGQCTSCHQPDLLVNNKSVRTAFYYPTANVPSPFTCENCHWPSGNTPHTPPLDWPKPIEAIGVVNSGDLHPSKPYRPDDGSHMQAIWGKVYYQCYFCHANTSNYASFDPANPLLIRYCENCHSKNSLHGIEEHITAGHGLTAEEKCISCHGGMPADPIVSAPKPPVITSISPSLGPNGTSLSISGDNFGSSGSIFLTARMGETNLTSVISSEDCSSWSNNLIECVPSGLGARNYDVKVETSNGTSNIRVFTLTETPDCIPCPAQLPTITKIVPKIGAVNALVTIKGQNFGDRHAGVRDVLLIGTDSAGTPLTVPANILSWTDNKIQFRIPGWTFSPGSTVQVKVKAETGESNQKNFKLTEEPRIDSMDYSDMVHLTITGKGFRPTKKGMRTDGYGWKSKINLNRPDQTITVSPENITSWSDTEVRLTLPPIQTDTYGVTVKTIYFYDLDKNGKYTSGIDTVYQTIESDPYPLKPYLTIQEVYTTDENGNRTEIFNPGQIIQYHFVYTFVGIGTLSDYTVKKVIEVFNGGLEIDTADLSETQAPGGPYHSIIEDTVPETGGYYTIYWTVKLKNGDILFDQEKTSSLLTVD